MQVTSCGGYSLWDVTHDVCHLWLSAAPGGRPYRRLRANALMVLSATGCLRGRGCEASGQLLAPFCMRSAEGLSFGCQYALAPAAAANFRAQRMSNGEAICHSLNTFYVWHVCGGISHAARITERCLMPVLSTHVPHTLPSFEAVGGQAIAVGMLIVAAM